MPDDVKVQLQAMKANGGVEVKVHSLLTSVLNGAEWSLYAPVALFSEKSPQINTE
jgi:hypothetical protein